MLYQGVCIVLVLVPESLHIHSIIFRALAVQHFHHVLFLELGRGEKIVKVERFHGAALREYAFVVFARQHEPAPHPKMIPRPPPDQARKR